MGVLGFYALYILRASWASQKYKVGIPPPFYRQGNWDLEGLILCLKSFSNRDYMQTHVCLTPASILRIITLSLRIFCVELPQLENLSCNKDPPPDWKSAFCTNLRFKCCFLSQGDFCYNVWASVIFDNSGKNHHYYKHWDWWDFC